MTAQFEIRGAEPSAVAAIQQEFGLPRFVAATMVAHGVKTLEEARHFLNPDLDEDWRNPYDIPQMKEAADRVEAAIRNNETILVFGDFDLDGISATTVLTRGLRSLGADAHWLIPRRFEEGYGLSDAAIARAQTECDPDLIITVDCGISCKDEAETVKSLGMELVVTDHHEPSENVPEGIIVVDPKCCEDNPSSILAGVGVALKLVQVLGARFGEPYLWRQYTDLATLGTVADLMPLRDENRALVADGLRQINTNPRPCIAALIGVCNVADKELTSTNLSFSLIPRLNAAGRMGDAGLAAKLLMEDDFGEAQKLAAELDAVNDQRRSIEADLAAVAKEQAEKIYDGQRALVVAGEGWHEGVKGIVASRLVNTYGVPSILFTITGDEARGSGRSVGQVNLFKAVESLSDMLVRFGGHAAAVGVTVPTDRLPEFNERLCAYMDSLPESSFHPLITIDTPVDLDELTIENVEQLERLAPFGQENPTPRLLARNVRIVNARAVGAAKNHLSCSLTDGVSRVDGIMFHCEGIEGLMACGGVVDAVFEVEIDEWRGRRKVKCMLKAVEPTATCPALSACLPSDDLEFIGEMYDEWDGGQDDDDDGFDPLSPEAKQLWITEATGDGSTLEDAIIASLIGDASKLHAAQRAALQSLDAKKNTLVVMGTGRGKSLIFQTKAAHLALNEHAASLFVYPLRALIDDQWYLMKELFEPFGLEVASLTGETSADERQRVYRGLADGTIDVVLTTPEYAVYHIDDIAASGRIKLMVVDEAHHMAEMGTRKRAAYGAMGTLAEKLGNPTVLALTATGPTKVANITDSILGIEQHVLDDTIRPNLQMDDRRNLRDKDSYLAGIVATGEKTIIYVNSRMGTVDLARTLRTMVPQVAMQIGFYNAGMSRDERERIGQLFRDDVLKVLVCTSAFGEGVNIPDVRHVVLYGMPFSEIEFNQMSGRAGRDGTEATIHLLFGRRDAEVCERILRTAAPSHDDMAQIYRTLRHMQSERPDDAFFPMDDVELASACGRSTITPESCAAGIAVFSELGLVEVREASEDAPRQIRVPNAKSRVELTDSVYYREGIEELDAFTRFKDWALRSTADMLRSHMITPILPHGE
ncbi:Single-stranded-DNA-specific exonuclease recJ [Slackia heliotrinireducens]|uniref:Single-stranded-DNA-specific exonuclease RecJ n=1 Tax=Slackia heliotrinireducens (strain ATCC 29202 / DSM 20476 / NCTC 11029 / RHS 1) TaxID=471855 RepID=C7N0X9_SLAHD|nr:single-stranded-DNA-specific exonuclease RecJ [Slackia heliotrinireducens]ACV23201.1 single-stranded-DNA-specific exonuclease RecJ [Slackia heliotrinireducens DSM 20476]VEH02293.1 Single-stranded-DNA-specific exonuclease recJ [Slackia heliotrinireducens]